MDDTQPVMRRFGAVLAMVALSIAAWAAPARAHEAVILTLHGGGRGSVWLTARWQDGHPLTEPAGVVLTATSQAGQRIGPVGLRRAGDALTYPDTLPPGEWSVVAEMGTPAIGRCAATLVVSATAPSPSSHRCGPSPAPVRAVSESSPVWGYGVSALSVLAVGAGVLWLVRRARTPPPRRAVRRR